MLRTCLLSLFLAVATSAFAEVKPCVFPASIRQALIDKSKQLNPTQYSTAGWSNRAATVLTPIHTDPAGVYTADRPFLWNDIDVGCRSTIIELPTASGKKGGKPDLFIHSPVGLDGPMLKAMEELGTVRYVFTPNYEHTKFAGAWKQNYKDAAMWGCPGIGERMPEIKWDGEIPIGYRPKGWKGKKATPADPPGVWDTEILQPLQIDVEKAPILNKPFFNEVIFYHAPTKTLLTTDLFWNYPASGTPNSEFGRDDSWELAPSLEGIPFGSSFWKFCMDKIYYPFFTNLMITDRSEYKAIADHILNVWDVETVIPAHGDILRGKEFIRSVLTKYFKLDE